MTFAQGRVS